MSDTTDKLCERLRKEIKVYNGRGTFRSERVNPDGPEAAAELTRLTTELAELRATSPAVRTPEDQVERVDKVIAAEIEAMDREQAAANFETEDEAMQMFTARLARVVVAALASDQSRT